MMKVISKASGFASLPEPLLFTQIKFDTRRSFRQRAIIIGAVSGENLFMPYANNKGTDQPVHLRSLISTFVVRCLDSIIPPVSIAEISSHYLVAVAVQAGLSLPWSQTLKTYFLVMRLIGLI